MNNKWLIYLQSGFAVFVIISLFWFFNKIAPVNYFILLFGLVIGYLILDTDHLIYWFYTHPEAEDSRLAKIIWQKKDYRSLIKLLISTQSEHLDLIFHHIIFQIVLIIVTFFVLSSTASVFGQAVLVAANIHLLIDEIVDYKASPQHLNAWLFARQSKQIPSHFLPHFIYTYIVIILLFVFWLVRTNL